MNNTAHNYVISMSNSECFSIYSQMTAHDETMEFLYLHSSYQTSITFGRRNKTMFMTTIFFMPFLTKICLRIYTGWARSITYNTTDSTNIL